MQLGKKTVNTSPMCGNKMQTHKDFLRWYNNKDVVCTLQAMQKMVHFYDKKGNDMLKLGWTLPKFENFCLRQSITEKFYP